MDADTQRSWRLEFARSAAYRREQERFFTDLRRRNKEAEHIDRAEDAAVDFAASMVLATDVEIAAFEAELDIYEEATVKALMENERKLDEVTKDIEQMLDDAQVLPDGRRVFKTKDGLRVFDEHGIELSPSEIDPDDIADWHTRWEPYQSKVEEYDALVQEREEILEFQAEVDEVRDEVAKGNVTKDKLEEFGDRLAARAPKAVQEQRPDYVEPETPNVKGAFGLAATTAPDPSSPAHRFSQLIPQ